MEGGPQPNYSNWSNSEENVTEPSCLSVELIDISSDEDESNEHCRPRDDNLPKGTAEYPNEDGENLVEHVYHIDYSIDPPEYLPGFHLKVPQKLTFEFMFPKLFRSLHLPPPNIPEVFLYWTCRNPTVLHHLMEEFTITSLGMVVESLKKDTAVRILFWKVGLTAMFGSYDAARLLRFAAYRLLKKDWESAFYLYIAAMIRIARKLETSKSKLLKYRDKDFGVVSYSANAGCIRKHPRVKKSIIKVKSCRTTCSILRTKNLFKKPFYIKKDLVKKMFKNTKENFLINEKNATKISAKEVARDLAYELAFSDCGISSTDKDFKYQFLFREHDNQIIKECLFKMVPYEQICNIFKDPAARFEKNIEESEDMYSKVILFNIPMEPSEQYLDHLTSGVESLMNPDISEPFKHGLEHSTSCVGSLMNPDISYLTKQIVNHVLKSQLKLERTLTVPVDCMDIETMKRAFQILIGSFITSQFTLTPKEHPILELPLKYLDIDLYFLIKLMSRNMVHGDKKIAELPSVGKPIEVITLD